MHRPPRLDGWEHVSVLVCRWVTEGLAVKQHKLVVSLELPHDGSSSGPKCASDQDFHEEHRLTRSRKSPIAFPVTRMYSLALDIDYQSRPPTVIPVIMYFCPKK
jgi:hypothetical protein